MKRKYEIVYIFDSALEEPEVSEHLDRFHELLKSPDQPEPIAGIAHWGKRTLAYPINKKEVGYYVVAHFEAETELLREFERIIKLDETVLRYLVVINEGLSVTRPDQPESTEPAADFGDSSVEGIEGTEPKASPDIPAQEPATGPVADADAEPAPSTDEGGE
jgi:small subunit ribosomal protein S6